MSKFTDILNQQQSNPTSALNNFLNGKPVATMDFGLDTATIFKSAIGIILVGVVIIIAYKIIEKKVKI